MTFPFLVNKVRSFGAAQTAKSLSLTTSSSSAAGQSRRSIITPLAFGGVQIRATFAADASLGWVCSHASVGQRSGSTAGTVATPVEFLFSGTAGFSIGANATIVSDWLTFSTSAGDSLLVTMDITSGGFKYDAVDAGGYSQATNPFYNNSSASGWSSAPNEYGSTLVEVRGIV